MRLVFKFIGSKLGLFVVLMTLLSMTVAAAQAQTLTTLLTFNGQTDGAYSSSGLVAGKGGNFYGTTQAGGIYNFNGGTVFRVNRAGHETVLHSFCARTNCADGSTPYGGVILDSSGNLYGATSGGGAHGFGAVFQLNSAGTESVLYSFKGLAAHDGDAPTYGNLVRDTAGNLYGATLNGGLSCTYSSLGCGIIYKVDAAGKETILHRFTGGSDGGIPPSDLTEGPGGKLYGTTFRGGSGGCGVVYEIGLTGDFKVLYRFSCSSGWGPNAGVAFDENGNLYGTTAFGGIEQRGTVFKLVLATGDEADLYEFEGGTVDGCAPGNGNVVLDAAGNIYGTTPSCGAGGEGIVFKVDPAGVETVLYSFSSDTGGGIPQTTLLRMDGKFYGTTYFSGSLACCGTVFELTP